MTLEQALEQLSSFETENLRLRVLVKRLEARITELERQLQQNSRNSSKPPSSDPSWQKRHGGKKKRSGKKRGGQPGHAGHHRKEVQHPDEVVDHYPDVCTECGERLDREVVKEAWTHQVVDFPDIKPIGSVYRAV